MKAVGTAVISIILLFNWSCNSQRERADTISPFETQIANAREIALELRKENKIPGMAIAVSVGGEMVWSEGFGYMDLENQIPVDPATTMFRIGSVSKTLTAAGLGILMDRDSIDPDAVIQTYVPDFPTKRAPITVKQVAGHIAGIRHYRGDEFMSGKSYPTVSEGLAIFQDDSLLFDPGTEYSYSSYGWNLISAVIEGASGQDFLEFMQNEVFEVLDMNNTVADWENREMSNLIKYYTRNDSIIDIAPFVDNSYKWAGGGFIATVEDLIRFGQAHMKPGFLSQETLDLLQDSQFLVNGDTTDYGMGWFSGVDEKGYPYVGHSGGSVGGITQFWMYPEQEVIVAIVTNLNPVSYADRDTKIAWCFMEEESVE
jgi:CubicO group peptidase (beta-lactamase class C family)